MSADESWTRVHRKPRRNSPRNASAAADKHHQPETFAPRTSGLLRPPDALRADYDKVRAEWLESPAHQALVRLVDEHAPRLGTVQRAVCLGIGTFDPGDGAWEAKRAAYVQLCALSTLMLQLEKYSKRSIECIFQEPILTDSDTAFLASLGHRIVASPAAYALIDNTTLLFAVHLYRPVYAAALHSNLPAVFVGTGWDVWDTAIMDKARDLENMKKMHQTYTTSAFPQDTASTAFSSTSIYWMQPDGVQPAASEGDKDDGAVQEEPVQCQDSTALEKYTSDASASTRTDSTTDEDTGKGKGG